jgi:hypothetical protein
MITLILMMIAGALNAIMDRIAFTFKSSVFKNLNPHFWNVKESWKNQWKWPLRPYNKKYYLGLYTPRYEEKFPFSSTFLIWTTDAWHLAKSLMLGFITLGIVLYCPMFNFIIDMFLYYCAFTIIFTYFYEYILKK